MMTQGLDNLVIFAQHVPIEFERDRHYLKDHDYCLDNKLPEEIEDGLHIFEGACKDCSIFPKFDSGRELCPPHSCADGSGSVAFDALTDDGCNSDCTTNSECKTNFQSKGKMWEVQQDARRVVSPIRNGDENFSRYP